MDDIAELRGRLVVLESMITAAITHIAATVPDPARLIVAIMSNAEDMIEAAAERAGADDRAAAQAARDCFEELSDALSAHITRGKSTT